MPDLTLAHVVVGELGLQVALAEAALGDDVGAVAEPSINRS